MVYDIYPKKSKVWPLKTIFCNSINTRYTLFIFWIFIFHVHSWSISFEVFCQQDFKEKRTFCLTILMVKKKSQITAKEIHVRH